MWFVASCGLWPAALFTAAPCLTQGQLLGSHALYSGLCEEVAWGLQGRTAPRVRQGDSLMGRTPVIYGPVQTGGSTLGPASSSSGASVLERDPAKTQQRVRRLYQLCVGKPEDLDKVDKVTLSHTGGRTPVTRIVLESLKDLSQPCTSPSPPDHPTSFAGRSDTPQETPPLHTNSCGLAQP